MFKVAKKKTGILEPLKKKNIQNLEFIIHKSKKSGKNLEFQTIFTGKTTRYKLDLKIY